VGSALGPHDGVGYFNRMYVIMTETLGRRIRTSSFASPEFIDRLEVRFANLYLAALSAPAAAPKPWAVLLGRRSDRKLAPLQFALAGMNAHINHDMPFGIGQACDDVGSGPSEGSHHDDYEKVNGVLASIEQEVRESFEQGEVLRLDRQFAGLENVAANWSIARARDAAWTNGEVLWELRGSPPLQRSYGAALADMVGMASRGLLVQL